jgi:hypothetical protein
LLGFGGARMTTSAQTRTKIAGFLVIVALSAITMLWLFWHYPVRTGIATIVVLAAFAVSARLARLIDTESMSELKRGKQSV